LTGIDRIDEQDLME